MILLRRLFLFYVLDLSIYLWKDSSPPSPTHTIYYAPKFRCQINLHPHNSTEYHAFHLTHQHFMDSPTSKKNPWQWRSNLHHSQNDHCSPTSQLDSGSGAFCFHLKPSFSLSSFTDLTYTFKASTPTRYWQRRDTTGTHVFQGSIIATSTLGNSLALSTEVEHVCTRWSSSSTPHYIQHVYQEIFYKDVYCSINYNCSKLEMTQCSITIEWI